MGENYSEWFAIARLIEDSLAVVSSSQTNEKYLILIREYINSKYHYSFRIYSMAFIELEENNSEIYSLRVFDPEIIEIVGEIVGYCQFNAKNEIYEYSPLN